MHLKSGKKTLFAFFYRVKIVKKHLLVKVSLLMFRLTLFFIAPQNKKPLGYVSCNIRLLQGQS